MKFMDKKISSGTEFIKYFKFKEEGPFQTVFHDNYPRDPFCPNITHNRKLLSWIEGAGICKQNTDNATLPEFISKREQNDFLQTLKRYADIFPMEAVFLGLRKDPNNQVKPNEVGCCSKQCGGHGDKQDNESGGSIVGGNFWYICGM